MTFDWSDYLDLAGYLAGKKDVVPSDEAKARTSISRSYYFIHHMARRYLKEEGDTVAFANINDPHRYVIEQFNRRADARLAHLGALLNRLKGGRIQADYEGELSFGFEEAERFWNLAIWLRSQFEREIQKLKLKRR